MPEAVLTTTNVSVQYGSGSTAFLAIQDVSASFHSGEVTLLMGASGSGKSTLLSVLGCLRTPDHGSVTILGRELKRASERDLIRLRGHSIGFVFQFFRLLRSLTALENVRLGLEFGRGSRGGMTPMQALEAVGLSKKRNLRPDQMSGGERQRVALARAIVKSPKILLADEPTGALDSESGLQIAALIRSLATEHAMAVVIATHDPRLAAFCDRSLEMRDGRVVTEDRSEP